MVASAVYCGMRKVLSQTGFPAVAHCHRRSGGRVLLSQRVCELGRKTQALVAGEVTVSIARAILETGYRSRVSFRVLTLSSVTSRYK